MKASWCGTMTEQIMHRQGHLTSKQRQAAGRYGEKCSNCIMLINSVSNKSPRCSVGKFATTINATCDKWVGKKL